MILIPDEQKKLADMLNGLLFVGILAKMMKDGNRNKILESKRKK